MRIAPIALTACALACAVGCRTTKDVLDDYERNMTAGNYAALPGEPAELAAKGDDSSLLWHLLAGGGFYLADAKADALRHFDAAEDAMQKNDATSVFAQGATGGLAMMTNDRAFPYGGGGQDRIFACLYKAVDYMCAGKTGPARTELNRAAQHQENWIWERRKDVEAAAARMEKDADAYVAQQQARPEGDRAQQTAGVLADASFAAQVREKCGFDPARSGNLATLTAADYMNAYVQHVCGVFRWLDGGGGRNFLKDAATLAPASAAARDFAEADKGLKPRNQVWIWAEDGLCPAREEWRIDLPLLLIPYAGRYVKYAGLCLPRLLERPDAAASWSIGGVPMEVIADVDALAKIEYDVYMRGAIAREITRTVIDVGLQVALGVTAEHTSDSTTRIALMASQYSVAAHRALRRGADIRCWTSLPKSVYLLRMQRPADGILSVNADGVDVVHTELPPGNSMVFVRKPSAAAVPSVKVITWP